MGETLIDRFQKDCENFFKTGNIVHPDEESLEAARSEQWHSHLSRTSLSRIALLRAMVMNPEVLIMHKPFVTFENKEADAYSDLMIQHVKEKGLELDVDKRPFRRPRTVLFSSASDLAIRKADYIYKVAKQTVTVLGLDELTSEDVGIGSPKRNSAETGPDLKDRIQDSPVGRQSDSVDSAAEPTEISAETV